MVIFYIVASLILAGAVTLLATRQVYRLSLSRLAASAGALGRSFLYFICDLLGSENIPLQTVNNAVADHVVAFAGLDFSGFSVRWQSLWAEVRRGENFLLFAQYLLFLTVRALYYACYVLMFGILLYIPVMVFSDEMNNDYNRDTKPLQIFKRFVARPVAAVFDVVADFCHWFRESYYWGLCLFCLTLALNFWTVLVGFFAWYFYFLVTVDLSSFGAQFQKLYYDILLCFRGAPWPVFAVLVLCLFLKWRKDRALDFLRHMERQNTGLQNEMPMCIFFTAPPRTGKTTMITAMALTFSAEFRRAALDLMEKNALRFPRFPWILLEKELQDAIGRHRVYNLATVRDWVRAHAELYWLSPHPKYIWNYDILKYSTTYDDGLWVRDLFEVVENYCQEYFIYFLETSLLIGNYSVREDYRIEDAGNLPMIDTDFFDLSAEEAQEASNYAHIIDFDMLRYGKKMVEDNAHNGGLEFGVVLISEIDKERKNDLRLKETKIKDEECNQKNDLFNEWLKMAGHAATVDGYCFLRVLSDAQRPSSWGADARELSTVAHVAKKGDPANALAFFWMEDAVISKYLIWFSAQHREERFRRGDNTLLGWLGMGLAGVLAKYRERRVNLYGYRVQPLELEAGTLDNVTDSKKYFITYKKVYAHRFGTDCFKAISETQALRCPTGMNDLAAYGDIYPTFAELEEQNSHFQKDMFRYYEIK